MKINRLLEITILLLNRKTVTAKELAERFSVSTRTIYRDVEVLSSAGVPVYMSKGNGGGISLLEEYALNKTFLSSQESEGLLLALKTMQATKYPEADALLEKVGAIFKNAADTDWVKIDFAGWSSFPNERNKFTDIKNAIFGKHVIAFDYINADGGRSHRRAEPERFYFNVHTWYLTAFCLQRNERRVFRLSRIKNVQVLDERFEKRVIVPERAPRWKGQTKPFVPLKLRFSGEVLYRLYDSFDERHFTRQEDGSILVEVAIPEDEWLYGFLLSFGPYVEILSPEHVRNIVIRRMREALQAYENKCFEYDKQLSQKGVMMGLSNTGGQKNMNIEMTSQAAQPTIYIRTRMTLENMTQTFDECYGALAAYLAELGEEIAGAPYAAYYNSDVNDMDTELGFPVSKALPEKGSIKAGMLPAYPKAVAITHTGSYDTLNESYEKIYGHIGAQKLSMAGPHYDFYVNDPSVTPAAELVTKVLIPVSDVPMQFCQSCGMPLGQAELFGTNADGSKNEDYCSYCFKDGSFVADITMDAMIAFCAENVGEWGMNVTKEEAIAQMKQFFPTLKRWQK